MALAWWKILLIVIASLLFAALLGWLILYLVTRSRARRLDPSLARIRQKSASLDKFTDLDEYSGTWYEIARYPQRFERDCINVTAQYERVGGKVRVVNTCQKRKTGKVTQGKGWAYPTEWDGVLAVSFFPGAFGNYTVVRREPDLSIVTNPKRSSLWILSRQRFISDERYESILDWLRANDFDTNRLEYPIQVEG